MSARLCWLPVTPHFNPSDLDKKHIALSQSLVAATKHLSHRLNTELSVPANVALECFTLAALFSDAAGKITAASGDPDYPNEEQSRETLKSGLDTTNLRLDSRDELERVVAIFDRYDRYLGTRRSPALSSSGHLIQLYSCFASVLRDLPRCMLDLQEVRALLEGMIATLRFAEGIEGASVDEAAQVLDEESVQTWDDPLAEALYRWKLGHHIFNLMTIQAVCALRQSTVSTTDAACVSGLKAASVLLRSTTAAMWYAEAFPPSLYVKHVRETMIIASGRGSGFSGTDNLEFRFFNIAFAEAFSALKSRFGEDPTEWPDQVWLAAYEFCDARQLDLEHHTLIAERVVGNQPSLKQLRSMERAERPQAAEDLTPAVEALRVLAARARSFKENLT